MDLKFYLNKFLKVDRVEDYTLNTLVELKGIYERFLGSTGGLDPDFPGIDFNEGKGEKISGRSMYSVLSAGDEEIVSDRAIWDPRNIDTDWTNFSLNR